MDRDSWATAPALVMRKQNDGGPFHLRIISMSFTVYILYGVKLNKYYIGQTSNLSERIIFHNNASFENSYTSKSDDWTLFFSIDCKSLKQALGVEKHIKSMKSRKYIENLVKYPDISKRLLDRY